MTAAASVRRRQMRNDGFRHQFSIVSRLAMGVVLEEMASGIAPSHKANVVLGRSVLLVRNRPCLGPRIHRPCHLVRVCNQGRRPVSRQHTECARLKHAGGDDILIDGHGLGLFRGNEQHNPARSPVAGRGYHRTECSGDLPRQLPFRHRRHHRAVDGFYGESGRVILLGGTILVIANIVLTFLGWIEHITGFERVNDTIARVEKAAAKAAQAVGRPPRCGQRQRRSIPDDATLIHLQDIGRITHVDIAPLREVADDLNCQIVLSALPGVMADPARMVAWTTAQVDAKQIERLRSAFTVAPDRAFDNDPRFGLSSFRELPQERCHRPSTTPAPPSR